MDKFSEQDLQALRSIPCELVLPLLCDHVKKDRDFTPLKNGHTARWHVHVAGHDHELLTTGPKFFDTHAGTGGGGAIDLTMHLFRMPFKQAMRKLQHLDVLSRQTKADV